MWRIMNGWDGYYQHSMYDEYEMHITEVNGQRRWKLLNRSTGWVHDLGDTAAQNGLYYASDLAEMIVNSREGVVTE